MTEPGWYPDPGGSTAARYWDGGAWTTHLRAGDHAHPYPSRTIPQGKKLVVSLSAALAVVVVLLVIGIVALFRSDDDPGRPTASPTSQNNTLSGTSDDWMASVCEPGKYMDGGTTMPDALSVGICLSNADGSSIAIGSFDTEFAAENAAAMRTNQGGSYATGADRTGTVWVFISSWQDQGDSLAPLEEFGFTIQ